MSPYSEITDLLENYYQPNLPWRNQWNLIEEMAWLIDDCTSFVVHRDSFGAAIKEGVTKAHNNVNIPLPTVERLNAIKENAIRDIESFRTKPEYWANIL